MLPSLILFLTTVNLEIALTVLYSYLSYHGITVLSQVGKS